MPNITTFAQAANYIAAGRNKTDRPLPGNATRLEYRDADTIAVRYHNTDVVTFHRSGLYGFDRGGMLSRTTANRIETYSPMRVLEGVQRSGWTGQLLKHGPETWILGKPNGDTVSLYDGERYIAA